MYNKLLDILPKENIYVNEPMSRHTTIRIGGPADFLLKVETEKQILSLIELFKTEKYPYFIMGNGSDLLVKDRGIRAAVIKTADGFKEVSVNSDTITAQSGALLSRVSNEALRNSLTGFEELSGIPGTVGGAVLMNAGAYGREFKDVTLSVYYIGDDGEIKNISGNELGFGYRKSFFSDKNLFILKAVLKLNRGEQLNIREKIAEVTAKRRQKQPLNLPSAGSAFKRPEGFFAAKLIDDAGLKGLTVGGAQVSEKHTGFIVNKNNASAADVISLIYKVQEEIYRKFKVELEPEIKIIGE